MIKIPPAHAGDIRDLGSIPGSGRSPGEVHGMLEVMGRKCVEREQLFKHKEREWAEEII